MSSQIQTKMKLAVSYEKEMPIHTSNAMIYNIKTKKPDRVGVLKLKDNKKVRVYKSTGEQIDL